MDQGAGRWNVTDFFAVELFMNEVRMDVYVTYSPT